MKLFLTIIVIALLNLFLSVSSLPVSGSLVPANSDGSSSIPQQVSTGGAEPKLTNLNPGDVVEVTFIERRRARLSEGPNFRAAVFVKKIEDIHVFLPLFISGENKRRVKLEEALPSLKEELLDLSFTRNGCKYSYIGADFRLWVSGIRKMTAHEKVVRDNPIFKSLAKLVNEQHEVRTSDAVTVHEELMELLLKKQGPEAGTSLGSACANPFQSLQALEAKYPHIQFNIRLSSLLRFPTIARNTAEGLPSGSGSGSSELASPRFAPYPTTAERAPRSPLGHPSSRQPRHRGQGSMDGAVTARAPGSSNEVTAEELRAMALASFNSRTPPGGRIPSIDQPHGSGQGPMDGAVAARAPGSSRPSNELTEEELLWHTSLTSHPPAWWK